jgi:c(7)-type cytochrome triheme protein
MVKEREGTMKQSLAFSVIVLLAVFAILSLSPDQSGAVGSGKVLTWQGGGAGQVVFEGKEHAEKGYVCNDCHSGLFSMKKGAASMTMAAMNKGEYCGACHNGKTAFGTEDKSKCHECHGKQHRHHGGHDDHNDDKKHRKHHDD